MGWIRADYLDKIKNTIKVKNYYVATVLFGPQPSFAYTIGLTKKLGFELVFCGGSNYTIDELIKIIEDVYKHLVGQPLTNDYFEIDGFGSFKLNKSDESWNKKILLGAYDYYKINEIKSYQILPNENSRLLDVPDMSKKWSKSNPIWKWIDEKWPYNIPPRSAVITNVKTLRGDIVTELTRWEINEWEMFAGAGPDVEENDIRIVSFGTMIGIDSSLEKAMDLEIGKGLWRASKNSEWNDWG